MGKNSNLHMAKKQKNDEFYTQLSDIENELRHYKQHFRGKVVFCNCDDPYESNFFKYFAMNFNSLGLKKLMATGYVTSPVAGEELSLFEDEEGVPKNQPYVAYINEVGDYNGDGRVDLSDVKLILRMKKNTRRKLHGDAVYPAGDFRSEESIALLKQADIVVTNPPFSLFREYVAQLVEYDKKFIILGNMNAITYKEIFPLIKDNKIWTGNKHFGGEMSNKSFDEKKEIYKDSKFYYTTRITQYDKWQIGEINDRSQKLANEARNIWKLPAQYQKKKAVSESLHTLGEDTSQFAYTKPSMLLVGSNEYSVNNWSDILPILCDVLAKENEEAFMEVANPEKIFAFGLEDGTHKYSENSLFAKVVNNVYVRQFMSSANILETAYKISDAYDKIVGTDYLSNILFSLK